MTEQECFDPMWSCSHCGPHPTSRGDWCDWGCGSDYNRMDSVRFGEGLAAYMKKVNLRHSRQSSRLTAAVAERDAAVEALRPFAARPEGDTDE